jgi:aspartate kinase
MDTLRIEANKEVSKVVIQGIPDQPGIAAEIFGDLGMMGFNIELVVSTGGARGTADICLAVASNQKDEVLKTLKAGQGDLGAADVVTDEAVALVSVIGSNLSKVPGVAGRMFKSLSAKGINIEIISTSLSSVTCLIPFEKTEEALAALEGEFIDEQTAR